MAREFLDQEGQKYQDFTLVTYRYIEELKTTLRELIHLPTGANVMHLENDDPENLFCLSFKTLPDSSNGAPHILEHTVLCGSRKFPVKDPFFAMNRRSLNTFMNALTGSDFTCYPAASQVEKDFYNLLEVYIDAVFHPLLKEFSFLQEGHRLEFSNPKDPKTSLEHKGIVYNEMKGSLTSTDVRIWHTLMQNLVPDLPYSYNSGGDPKEIPNLSYQQLIEFHETYYHPSRCLFFFYGNFDLKKHLDFITEHALKGAQKLPPLDGIGHQKRFTKPVRKELTYPTTETSELDAKHIHAFGWLTAPLLNQEEILSLTILDSVLMDTDASPLKKALLDSKLCIHADSHLEVEMTEVPMMIVCRGCKKEDLKALEEILFDTLKKIQKQGLPTHLIEASIHQLEFERTEIGSNHSPFGLTLFMRSALAKQHGCNPENALTLHALFEDLIQKTKDPLFFSSLIEKYFVNNPHFVLLSFSPDPDLTSKEIEEEKLSLEKLKLSLSEKQVSHILDQSKQLLDYQKTLEGQKLECLPKVTLLDVPRQVRDFPLQRIQHSSLEVFHHETFTNHILYADLLFDLPYFNEEELFDLQIFITLWPELGVGKRSYGQNLEFMQAYTGGVGTHCSLHVQTHDPNHYKPTLQIHGKALERNTDKLFLLFEEMLLSPRLDEHRRIEELIKKFASALQNRLSRNAMRYASQLALSGFSIPNHIHQLSHGLSFYKKMQSLARDLSKKMPALIERLQHIKEKLLCVGTPQIVLSCDERIFRFLDKQQFFGLPKIQCKPHKQEKPSYILSTVVNQARPISSPVAFIAQGFKTVHYLHEDAPALQVGTVLLENKILHHRIREQGGAYGAGASYNSLWGNFYLHSYRDPHIARTLRTFKDAVDEIAQGSFDLQDLEEAKLGIIQELDTPIAPGSRGLTSYSWQRDGKTKNIRQTFRDHLLQLQSEEIQRAFERHLQQPFEQSVIAIFAGEKLISKELALIEDKKIQVMPIT